MTTMNEDQGGTTGAIQPNEHYCYELYKKNEDDLYYTGKAVAGE